MADPAAGLLPTHPLEAWSTAFAGLPDPVGITVEPFVATVDVRVGAGAGTVDAVSERLGVDLPARPDTWLAIDDGRAVRLGPDEWLLTSTVEAPHELEARVRAAVVPFGGSAADVSAQRIALRLTGERVRDILAKGCAIDLHPRVFGRGRSAQTTLGLAGVVLLALSDTGDDYLVLVRSSFAGYLADWLLDAALEFTGRP
ncbi:sarcosine oxidase subunit gamma [Pseudonocardia sp.]|uniref:sarcosine oxidase subunit gamma n=1 Tax=Pseudonocardia sp. TaxID=60912 RepID=UPI003D113459